MDFEVEKPAYAQLKTKPNEPRILVFENEGSEVAKREFAKYGLELNQAWTDDSRGMVAVKRGDLVFRVRPGYNVFAAIRAA